MDLPPPPGRRKSQGKPRNPAANLKVVNQNGGGNLPAPNAGWAGEISLDVEWAHAIAPAASILLVQANSDNTET